MCATTVIEGVRDSSHPPHSDLAVRSFGMTDCGRVRKNNEDQFFIATLTKSLGVEQTSLPEENVKRSDKQGHVFAVADGFGGAPAGEHASALAVECIEDFLVNKLKWFFRLKGPEEDKVLAEFQEALRKADDRLFDESAEHPEIDGMGTTLTLAYSLGNILFIAHAGDSRCYLFHDGKLSRMTKDHTLAEALFGKDDCVPSPSTEKARRRLSHIITNAIGGSSPGVTAEVHKHTLEAGDLLLLATDGMTREVSDERIAAILQAERDPETASRLLVDEAINAGGRDNVTVIVASYGG